MNGIYPLFSSSKGNAVYIGNTERGILIDAGASYKRLGAAMQRCGLDMSSVKAVFITHEHSDHVKGLLMITKKHDIPVYGQSGTLHSISVSGCIREGAQLISTDGGVRIDDMFICGFDTPHDTHQSCGYKVTFDDGSTCAVCTDLGCITKTVDDALLGTGTVLLEANYDEEMILTGSYPYQVKQRIRSDRGHLSNTDSAIQVRRLVENGTRNIILGHLSQENNMPQLAERAVVKRMKDFVRDVDYTLRIAEPETTGGMVVIQTCLT